MRTSALESLIMRAPLIVSRALRQRANAQQNCNTRKL
jgi:hypothetical protein